MVNRKIIISGEGRSGFSSDNTSTSISITSAEQGDITRTYRVVNQMVADGIILNYALGGAMGAFFYIEPSHTSDMDMFCLLAHDPHPSGLISLEPILGYLKGKGHEPTQIGAMIHGIDVQFQFPDDPLSEASIETAITHDLSGTPVRVMRPEYLVSHMLKTNRPKDRIRLLRFIESQAFDPAAVYSILTEHGLESKYEILERLEGEASQ
jgi:hypothetical protein